MDQVIKHNGEFTDTGIKDAQPTKVGNLRVGGVLLQPGATATVPDWERVERSHAVKTWLRIGIISKVAGNAQATEADEENPNPETEQKRQIIGELKGFGIVKTERTSLENLQAALDEAKAKAGDGGTVKLPGMPT